MNSKLYIALVAIALALAAGLSYLSYRRGFDRGVESVPVVEPQIDSIIIRDTIRPEPIIKWKRVVATEYIPVPVRDTIRLHDTLMVPVNREAVVYADSNYRAVVSGILPSLDSIEIYQSTIKVTQYVPVKQPAKRWGIGPAVGIGIGQTFGQESSTALYPGWYFGISIHYDLLQF